MSAPRFDESLPLLVRTLSGLAGPDFVARGTVLRDASGRLTFVSDRAPKDEPERKALAEALGQALGPYARPGRPILFRGDPGAEPILEAADSLPIQVADVFCHLLDRRIVGSGWLDAPKPRRPEAPRVVFATLKGGVGRSTAIDRHRGRFLRGATGTFWSSISISKRPAWETFCSTTTARQSSASLTTLSKTASEESPTPICALMWHRAN